MAFHSHDSQTRSNNRWSWPRGVEGGGGGGGVTTIMRPRGHDQECGGLTTYQHCTCLFRFAFRLKPHAGKRTGHAEPARWERLKKKTRRRIINKEWEVNGSTWSLGIKLISLVSSGTVVGDSSRGTGEGYPGDRCCGERFKSPGSRARLWFFFMQVGRNDGFAKTENIDKRGAGMLACDPPVTQIRYWGEHQCWNDYSKLEY